MKKISITALELWILVVLINCFDYRQTSLLKSEQTNQTIYVKDITIKDKSGINQLQLRLSSVDSHFLNSYTSIPWKLTPLPHNYGGSTQLLTETSTDESQFQPSTAKLHIEVVRKSLPEDIDLFYIERPINDSNAKQTLIETEYISELESLGGTILFANPKINSNEMICYQAETLDDLSIAPYSGEQIIPNESPFGLIDFSDHKGMSHAWRVLLKHDVSLFPIVIWSDNRTSKFP